MSAKSFVNRHVQLCSSLPYLFEIECSVSGSKLACKIIECSRMFYSSLLLTWRRSPSRTKVSRCPKLMAAMMNMVESRSTTTARLYISHETLTCSLDNILQSQEPTQQFIIRSYAIPNLILQIVHSRRSHWTKDHKISTLRLLEAIV